MSIVSFLILLTYSCEKEPVIKEEFTWPTSSPGRQSMSSELLEAAMEEADSVGFIDAMIVVRNGHIIAEEYYNGFDRSTPHNVMSVSKSFLSAVAGLAMDQGYFAIDDRILDYLPEYNDLEADPRISNVTIRHLLTMRMGIKGEADDNYGVYAELYGSPDWVKATLESEMIDDPGEKMHYNTFQTHLLSVIISRATNQSTLDFGREVLFDPMGIDLDFWEQDPQGYYFGGNSMYVTPREMAALGFLYLNLGIINDTPIIPDSWITFSLSASSNFTHPNEWGAWKDYNYAYLWWLGKINNYNMFMAYGYGGQFVVAFPELELIIVTTAKNQVDPDTSTSQELTIFDIISRFLLTAVND